VALSLVQTADAAGTNTAAPAFGSNVTLNSLIMAIGGPYANGGVPTETVTGVTDTRSNSFSPITVSGTLNDGVHTKGAAYLSGVSSAGADTVTLACSGAPAGGGSIAGIFEIAGSNVVVETAAALSGTTSGVVTGPSLVTAGPALIVAFQFSFAITNSSNNNSWTGYVTGLGDGIASKAVGAGTTVVNAFNMTANGSNPWFIIAVAFKENTASASDWGGRGGRTNLAQALLAQRADLDRPDRAQRYLRAQRDRWTNPDRARDLLGRTAARRAA